MPTIPIDAALAFFKDLDTNHEYNTNVSFKLFQAMLRQEPIYPEATMLAGIIANKLFDLAPDSPQAKIDELATTIVNYHNSIYSSIAEVYPTRSAADNAFKALIELL